MPTINDSVQFLKGVGPAFAKKFEKLGILTIRDLLTLRGGVKTPPYEAKDKWAVMARLRAGHARPLQGSDVKWRSSRKQQSFIFAGVRGRLAAHNERRQFAAQTRSCGCLPRRGKHCSLPSFAALNCGPALATPQHPSLRWRKARRR